MSFNMLSWMVLLIATIKQCTSASNVENGYQSKGESVRQYYFDITGRTWEEARIFCNESYNGLATIITQEDFNNAIYEIPQMVGNSITEIWIGLNDRLTEAQWIWDDGTPCSYNSTSGGHDCSDFWGSNQPDDWQLDENCGDLWLGSGRFIFNDLACDNILPVLCNIIPELEYIYDGTFRNFTEAETYCNTNHEGLATIQTTNEYIKAISVLSLGVTQAYIGLNDRKNESHWEWSNGDSCIDIRSDDNITLSHDCSTFWAPDEPNDYGEGEDCTELKYYDGDVWLINDTPCSKNLGVLCTAAVTSHPTVQPVDIPDIENDRYAFTREFRTWAESMIYCDQNYEGLATIITMDDLHSATSVLPTNWDALNLHHIWIGINDIEEEGIWSWIDGTPCRWMNGSLTQNPICSDLWGELQPDDWQSHEDCGSLRWYNNLWRFNDAGCDGYKTAICRKNLLTSMPTTTTTITPTKQPITRTSDIQTTTTVTKGNGGCETDNTETSNTSLVVVLVVVIVVLIILLGLAIYNMYKYKKMVQSVMVKYSMEQQDNVTTDAMDMQLVTNDQFQT